MNVFDENLSILKELSGSFLTAEKIERIKFIFEQTENSWRENLKRFKDKEIKYLLICEAPPFSEKEIPTFFYNQSDKTLNRNVWKALIPNLEKPKDEMEYYQKLADEGFLLVDTLPFSLEYKKIRRKKHYRELIASSFPWFLKKLNDNNLKFSDDLKIAFGFKINAEIFIETVENKLSIKNKIYPVAARNIAYDGSGMPNYKPLRKIFKDEFPLFRFFKGEEQNPYFKEGFELDFSNPKSLFWYYEKEFYFSEEKDFKHFMTNLIDNKLSEYHRGTFDLWEMYFENSVKINN